MIYKAIYTQVLLLSCCCNVIAQGDGDRLFFRKTSLSSVTAAIQQAKLIGKTDTAKAVALFSKAIQEAEKAGDFYSAGMAYYERAEMFSRYNSHDKTFGNYFNARPFFAKVKAEKELAYTLFGLGREQYYRGNFNAAANHLNYTILAAQKLKLTELEAEAMAYLAIIYHEIPYYGRDRKNTWDLLKAVNIKERINDKKGILNLLPKLSNMYLVKKQYDSALHYCNAAIKLAEELEATDILILSRLDKAELFTLFKQYDEVYKQLKLVKNMMPFTHNPNLTIGYYAATAVLKVAEGNDAIALVNYDSAMQYATKFETLESMVNVFKMMGDAYARRNEFEKAYTFQKDYNWLIAKLYNPGNRNHYNNSAFLIGEMLAKDEVRELIIVNELKQMGLLREMELRKGLERENILKDSILRQEKVLRAALQKEDNYKSSQLENEKQIRMAEAGKLKQEQRLKVTLLIGLVTALLMGSIIFYQYKREQHKSSIIRKQSDELQTLMKEMHHRVKNNLQIVSSLLNLQSHYIKDAEAIEAVKESRNRMLSMAFIHQSLYREGDLRSVQAQEYIENICNSLTASYNLVPGKIRVQKEVTPLSFNVDALMPVGLIINELITNSIKHAFPGNQNGTIKVILKEEGNVLKLQVHDDGVGLPAHGHALNESSFGFKMIHSFLQKLKGDMWIYSQNGTKVDINIRHYK